ncbi:nicotinate-nucleotide adenylyltransferase [Ligilactobacillus cholophilus]|uniref:nicotinate-nucleotide adenylyltransferase n=1 Tax=Ligilactobacillus cholophilus TaxID=3050131 RepID=UPI0025B09F3F|nr:nicotinate-nucleotide adenylyltransferase [Ligilactobacillus cholophilus]
MNVQKIISPEVKIMHEVELDDTKKRIGILGGTFNPIHLGHLIIADQVLDQLDLDKVLFMPDNIPPHIDHKKAISAEKRLKMLELATQDNPKFGVEDYEIKKGGISFSIDTFRELTKLHPENKYYFIIGGDMVEYLPKWREIDELVNLVQFIGVRRPGFSTKTKYPVIWVDVPELAISSTLIRQKIKQGCSINYLVPKEVEEYIQKENLYID